MAVGRSGLGKTTLVNTLFTNHLVENKVPKKTTEIHTISYQVEENGMKMKLCLIDSPGFGDQINNDLCWEPICRYIKDQYAVYLRKELSPVREKIIIDSRVHVVLYFICPTGHSLSPLDIVAMKKLSEISNVIPIVSKSDCLTIEERADFKQRIRDEIRFHGINIFPFDTSIIDDLDAEEKALNESIRKMIPFAVVGSESSLNIDGKIVKGRKKKWGTINIEDPLHCEFVHLRNFLIRSHLMSLIEATNYLHYENFRSKQLLALKESSNKYGN
jgi:septin 3/9/12